MTIRGSLADLPDAALISRFLGGSEDAFRTLYHRHTPRLRMLVARLLGAARQDAVDDVMQETWLAGCRGLHRYSGEAKFSTWLTTIGIRAAYARSGGSADVETDLFDDLATPSGPGPASAIDLERALGRLTDRQRVVVVLHDLEGFTHQEIATQLGIANGTAKATLSRALRAAPTIDRRSLSCWMISTRLSATIGSASCFPSCLARVRPRPVSSTAS